MASRAVLYFGRLSVGRSLGRSSHLSASSRLTPLPEQRLFRALPVLPSSRAQWSRCSVGNSGRLFYSTSSGGGEEGEGEGGEGGVHEEEDVEGGDEAQRGLHQQYALAPITIPDVFPEVPVLPISRNPIFPKFVKMLDVRNQSAVHVYIHVVRPLLMQISDRQLMNLIRRKVRLAMPYAGAFLKKDDR